MSLSSVLHSSLSEKPGENVDGNVSVDVILFSSDAPWWTTALRLENHRSVSLRPQTVFAANLDFFFLLFFLNARPEVDTEKI